MNDKKIIQLQERLILLLEEYTIQTINSQTLHILQEIDRYKREIARLRETPKDGCASM